MTNKEKILQECREDFICYIEEFIKIKDKDGNIIDFKLSKFQIKILDSILTKHFQNLSAVSKQRILKRIK